MVGIELQMITTFYLFRYLKGRCHGNQLNSKNSYRPIYFAALPFGKGLQYRNSDFKRINRMNISTSCAILVTFRPETSEFTLLTIAPFWQYGKNRHITPNISEFSGPTLIYFTGLVGALMGMIFENIRFAAAQGTLLWQPVKYGRRSQTLYRHSTTDWPIVNLLSKDLMAIIRLHHFQIW